MKRFSVNVMVDLEVDDSFSVDQLLVGCYDNKITFTDGSNSATVVDWDCSQSYLVEQE